ncbi:hypothetical protein [Acinetobacter sp. ANC 4648]|uniref:hypothetical protein n=1 Tax=Acinetobacter sp. ANC 4648 TaxID=1977875 RepID=UPI000A345A90|nr:hypothetical protein [Acinetobacter sp. ANC 4648]OTG82337.1 hypothetical protein B9T27_08870 [Acinetobacter sp. ANC 4648]
MKYYKLNNEVYAFDQTQGDLITNDFVAMTDEEVDRHIHPQKYLSDEEKEAIRLAAFKPITRRQFKLTLLEFGILTQIEQAIDAIEDVTMRMRIQIEYTEAITFERASDAILYMSQLINLNTNQVDEMWVHALSL